MRPTFVISLDEELVWGSFDHTRAAAFDTQYPDLRGVVRDLVGLFDTYRVPTTWAIVGHLFLSSCDRGPDGRPHPELVQPQHSWFPRDWLADDPCTDRSRDPMWYGDDIVDMVQNARTPQEIGSHSFAHVVYGDPGCTAEVAESDLAASIRVAKERGLSLRSFVFPRNSEGHHRLLRSHGFTAYRGEDPTWYRTARGPLKRVSHLFDQAAAIAPPVSTPHELIPGLWNIPGSMLLLPRGGVRRFVPIEARVAKARAGLERAIREQKVFHLWFHPFNMAVDRGAMFAALRAILAEAVGLQDRGLLEIRTMGDLAEGLAHERAATGQVRSLPV